MVLCCCARSPRGEGRFPAGPRALLSWFQSGRKGLGSCNRFEELNKQLLTAYFEVIQEHFLGRYHLVYLTKEMVKKTM